MKILPLILVAACIACGAARAQDDGEGRAAPSRGLLKRGLLAKGKQTTTTTTPAPQEEAEYDEDYAEGEGEANEPSTEAPPSSTEGKKLVAGGVRPFRSNTDLLEALKRRRAQAAEAKLHGHSNVAAHATPAQDGQAEPAAAPAKSSYTNSRQGRKITQKPLQPPSNNNVKLNNTMKTQKRRQNNSIAWGTVENREISIEPTVVTKRAITRNGKLQSTPAVKKYEIPHPTPYPRKAPQSQNIGKKRYSTVTKEIQNEEASAPAPVKPSRGRFGRPSSRSIQEDHEEQNESAPAPIRTGRTFPRRASN